MSERRFFRTRSNRHAAGVAHGKKKRAQVCVVDAQLCSAPADGDDQTPQLTGLYQEKTSGRPRYTIQVNQAGDHVRVWVRQVLHSGFGPNEHTARRWRFCGRRDRGQGIFRLFKDASTWDYKDGTLEGSPDSLEFTGSGITGGELSKLTFVRCKGTAAQAPVYADRIRGELEAGGEEPLRLAYEEYYRLPEYDIERIKSATRGPELKALLTAFLEAPRGELGDFSMGAWKAWNQRILDLDNFIASRIFHRKPRTPSGKIGLGAEGSLQPDGSPDSWHPSDEAAVKDLAFLNLRFEPYRHGKETRSMLGALTFVMQERARSQANPSGWQAYEDFLALKKLLGLPDPGPGAAKPFKYTFEFSAAALSAGVIVVGKGLIGTVNISRDTTQMGGFDFFMPAGGAGTPTLSLSLITDIIVVESYQRWEAEDFKGSLVYVEAGGDYGFGPLAAEAKVGAIQVNGSGRNEPLVLDLSGAGRKMPEGQKYETKWGGGASGVLGRGYLWSSLDRRPAFVREESDQPLQTIAFVNQLSEQQLVHFFEGDSRLTPWGRQVMGMFCADELRFLCDKKSTLSIFAYTDPEGSDQSNQTLSGHRAMNTMQALADIVSPERMRSTLGVVEGMGELPSRVQGHVRNGAEDPRWRRVDVILDNHVLLELHVPRRP